MEKKEYHTMHNIEDNYWWYVGLRELVLSFINKYRKEKHRVRILDAGCGTGKILESFESNETFGLDFSDEAMKYCKMRKLNNLVRGSICNAPFKKDAFDIVISLDVLYHVGVENDIKTLEDLGHIMKPEGMLIINLPAYNFLRSEHDNAVHTRQRYTIRGLKGKVEKAGFIVERITYRNTFLFPFICIMRLIEHIIPEKAEQVESDLKPLPDLLNKFLTNLLIVENMMIRSGTNFPFGLSVYCIARKH